MCKASIDAVRIEPAKTGDKLNIGLSNHGFGAFHRPGQSVAQGVVCAKDGTVVMLSKLPPIDDPNIDMRLFNQEPPLIATFQENGDNVDDQLVFEDGLAIYFGHFGDRGIEAIIRETIQIHDLGHRPSVETDDDFYEAAELLTA